MTKEAKELKRRCRSKEVMLWQQDFSSFDELFKKEMVLFKCIDGMYVPSSPWSVRFLVTRDFLTQEMVEIQPLTVTRLFVYLIQNFISMSWWKFKIILYKIGFMEVPTIDEPLSFSLHWNWNWKAVRGQRRRSDNLFNAEFYAADLVAQMDKELTIKFGEKDHGKRKT